MQGSTAKYMEAELLRKLRDPACLRQNLIQCTGKVRRALAERRVALVLALEHLKFVGDVDGGKHGEAQGVDGLRLLGDGAHLRVHIFAKLQDVFRVD